MTEKQYEQYREIKKEIDNLKSFLFACGVKYRKTTGRFPTKLIRRGKRVKMYNGCDCCEYDISPTLQKLKLKHTKSLQRGCARGKCRTIKQ